MWLKELVKVIEAIDKTSWATKVLLGLISIPVALIFGFIYLFVG